MATGKCYQCDTEGPVEGMTCKSKDRPGHNAQYICKPCNALTSRTNTVLKNRPDMDDFKNLAPGDKKTFMQTSKYLLGDNLATAMSETIMHYKIQNQEP